MNEDIIENIARQFAPLPLRSLLLPENGEDFQMYAQRFQHCGVPDLQPATCSALVAGVLHGLESRG